jgi:hypothetical protein
MIFHESTLSLPCIEVIIGSYLCYLTTLCQLQRLSRWEVIANVGKDCEGGDHLNFQGVVLEWLRKNCKQV